MGGVMGSYHSNPLDHGWAPAAQAGVGISKSITDSVDFRVEGAYRYDWDDKTFPQRNGYGDWYLGFSLVARIGETAGRSGPCRPAAAGSTGLLQAVPQRREPVRPTSARICRKARSWVRMAARRRW